MPDLNLSIDTAAVHLNPESKATYAPRQLLTPLPEPGHFLLVIDNSSLEVFTTCPQSAYYKLVLKREAHARNAALTFGGAIHEGLESFLLNQWNAKQTSLGDCVIESCNDEAQNQRILRFFTENPAPLDEYRTVTNALAVLAAYRERAALPDYQWEIQSDSEGPLIERAFELPLGVVEVNDTIQMPWLMDKLSEVPVGYWDEATYPKKPGFFVSHIHIAWSGRMDVIARCQGAVRVCDHKTGMVNPQEYQIASQTVGYVWAGQQMWPELNITGFCLNALATKKPAAGTKITDPGPSGGKPSLELFRAYFDYTPERIADWQADTLDIVSDFIHCLVRGRHPKHTKWCKGKYGWCQYHDVCVQDSVAVRSAMIHSDMFKGVTWNPVAGR